MYTKYFGFNEKPFTLTPNPRFIFLSNNHKEAFAHLLYGINNHYGFIQLIGEVGSGKTTVLRTLLNQLTENSYRTALLFNHCRTGIELLRSINNEFGLNSISEYTNELLGELYAFLLEEHSRGITVVLVIDEAQNVSPEILEQLRLISNLETENDKLIQIVLAGQPELSKLLQLPELRQLNQRIAVRYQLKALGRVETCGYIHHRMAIAGETGGVTFTGPALALIYCYSRGLPRLINNLCDRALLIGYGDEQRRISSFIVLRAMGELLAMSRGKRQFQKAGIVLITGVIVPLGFLSAAKWEKQTHHSTAAVISTSEAVSSTKTPEAAADLVAKRRLQLQREMLSYEQNDVHIQAFNAIAQSWGANPIRQFRGSLTIPGMFTRLAAKRNFRITDFKGSLTEVLRFEQPFILVTTVGGSFGNYCISVTPYSSTAVSIDPPLFGSSTLTHADLNAISSGSYYMVWQNTGQIPDTITPGEKRYEIRALQQLLLKAGRYHEAISGTYSDATVRAVTDFQQSSGIPRNDTVGELTLAALSRFNSGKHLVPNPSSGGAP